jgi:NADH-quinone oxidoreductase subunit G
MSEASREGITLSIDGKEVTVPKGTLIIRAAEQIGIEIPRFCDHPYLDPVGACRQCYVEVEGQRKLLTSCTTPVAPDMVVRTHNTSETAKQAQESNLEFLLLNHPLDCPICDRGGECPLQDQALAFGPGESRYTDPKRTYAKPLPLSPLVALDRERCVLCARCTRFCSEISGDQFIELYDRGAAEQVAIAAGEDFRSPFSGNTIQICPVGALTSIPYRFAARPFDLKRADAVCPHCASGCNIRADVRRGRVVRHLARDNPEVNDAWTCDKGRFAFAFPDSDERLATPMLRRPGLEPSSFGEVMSAIAEWSSQGRVGFLTGGRLMDEDYFALSKLARTAFRTNDLDHRRHRTDESVLGIEAFAAAGMPVTYRDVENAETIVVVGLDAEQELPILHLRIRKAARRGARVIVIHPRRTRLWDVARHEIVAPGEESGALERVAGEVGDGAIVIAGPRLAEAPEALSYAAELAGAKGGGFAFVGRRAGDRGALRAGVHPRLLPGGRLIDDAGDRVDVERVWGNLPDETGRDAAGILEAAARREIDVLYLIGVDPLRDFPDATLARHALENVERRVVQDINSDLAVYADAMLPAASFLEKDGHFTDWEGRGQRIRSVRSPTGLSRPDWQILQELSEVMGADMGFHSLDDLHLEMGGLLRPWGARAEVGSAVGERFPRSASPRSVHMFPSGEPLPARAEPAEGLVLFTYPLLIDEGTLSRGADELKAALEDEAFVEINLSDAERLGLEDGGRALVRTEAGAAELPVRVTGDIAAGSVFVPFNQPGLQANTLLSGAFTAPVTLEPSAKAVAAEGAAR